MTAGLDGATFEVTRRGYDRTQVDQRIARLADQVDAVTAAHEDATTQLRTMARQLEANRGELRNAEADRDRAAEEIERLTNQVAELSTIPSSVNGMSERLQQMVRIAQDDVNDMRARATASATQILTMAQAEANEQEERSRAEHAAFEAERRAAEEELRAQLLESRTHLEKTRKDSEGQRARLDAELAEQRELAMTELAKELDVARTAVNAELAGQRDRLREEASHVLDTARAEAKARIGAATAEAGRLRAESLGDIEAAQQHLDELRALQQQVSGQLTSVRALLDWTLPQMGESGAAVDRPIPATGPDAARPAQADPPAAPDAAAAAPAVDADRHAAGPPAQGRPSPAGRGTPASDRSVSPR